MRKFNRQPSNDIKDNEGKSERVDLRLSEDKAEDLSLKQKLFEYFSQHIKVASLESLEEEFIYRLTAAIQDIKVNKSLLSKALVLYFLQSENKQPISVSKFVSKLDWYYYLFKDNIKFLLRAGFVEGQLDFFSGLDLAQIGKLREFALKRSGASANVFYEGEIIKVARALSPLFKVDKDPAKLPEYLRKMCSESDYFDFGVLFEHLKDTLTAPRIFNDNFVDFLYYSVGLSTHNIIFFYRAIAEVLDELQDKHELSLPEVVMFAVKYKLGISVLLKFIKHFKDKPFTAQEAIDVLTNPDFIYANIKDKDVLQALLEPLKDTLITLYPHDEIEKFYLAEYMIAGGLADNVSIAPLDFKRSLFVLKNISAPNLFNFLLKQGAIKFDEDVINALLQNSFLEKNINLVTSMLTYIPDSETFEKVLKVAAERVERFHRSTKYKSRQGYSIGDVFLNGLIKFKLSLPPDQLKRYTSILEEPGKTRDFVEILQLSVGEKQAQEFLSQAYELYTIPEQFRSCVKINYPDKIRTKQLEEMLVRNAAESDLSFAFFKGNLPVDEFASASKTLTIKHFIQQASKEDLEFLDSLELEDKPLLEQIRILEKQTRPDIDAIFGKERVDFTPEKKPSLVFYIRFYGDVGLWQGSDLIQSGLFITDLARIIKKHQDFFGKLYIVPRIDKRVFIDEVGKEFILNPYAGKAVWALNLLSGMEEFSTQEGKNWLADRIRFVPETSFGNLVGETDTYFIQLTHGYKIDAKPGILGSIFMDSTVADPSRLRHKVLTNIYWPGEEQNAEHREKASQRPNLTLNRERLANSVFELMHLLKYLYTQDRERY